MKIEVRYCSFCRVTISVDTDGSEKIQGESAVGHIDLYPSTKLLGFCAVCRDKVFGALLSRAEAATIST